MNRLAVTYGTFPWIIDRLPHKVRAEMLDYMIDAAEFQAEAMRTDSDDDVEDVDFDKLMERRRKGLG